MTYTKRWELIHHLGGKCINCGNENFFDLEIDHKFNDGEGDRALYKDVVGHYLSRITRAKERLQILCKKCHEEKHHPIIVIPEISQKQQEQNHVLFTIKKLEGEFRKPVEINTLIAELGGDDNEAWQIKWNNEIRKLLREAEIYESKPGYVNLV